MGLSPSGATVADAARGGGRAEGSSAPSTDGDDISPRSGFDLSRLWRAPAAGELLWLDSPTGEAVLFDRRSAQTHLLNPHAATALRILVEGPADAASLASGLSRATGLELVASRALSTEILRVFDKLGLVEPAEL